MAGLEAGKKGAGEVFRCAGGLDFPPEGAAVMEVGRTRMGRDLPDFRQANYFVAEGKEESRFSNRGATEFPKPPSNQGWIDDCRFLSLDF